MIVHSFGFLCILCKTCLKLIHSGEVVSVQRLMFHLLRYLLDFNKICYWGSTLEVVGYIEFWFVLVSYNPYMKFKLILLKIFSEMMHHIEISIWQIICLTKVNFYFMPFSVANF